VTRPKDLPLRECGKISAHDGHEWDVWAIKHSGIRDGGAYVQIENVKIRVWCRGVQRD